MNIPDPQNDNVQKQSDAFLPLLAEANAPKPELSQEELEAYYREQQARRFCSGCGDTPIY